MSSGTERKPSDRGVGGYRLEEQVGFLMRRASQRHLAIFAGLIGELTPTQFSALLKTVELGPISQNELGRTVAMDAATIKGVVKRLAERGLVQSEPSPTDKRRLMIAATPDGRALLATLTGRAARITEETLEPLAPAERKTFLRLLEKLC